VSANPRILPTQPVRERVLLMSDEAARTAGEQFNRLDRPSTYKDWLALLRLLDRKGSHYAD